MVVALQRTDLKGSDPLTSRILAALAGAGAFAVLRCPPPLKPPKTGRARPLEGGSPICDAAGEPAQGGFGSPLPLRQHIGVLEFFRRYPQMFLVTIGASAIFTTSSSAFPSARNGVRHVNFRNVCQIEGGALS